MYHELINKTIGDIMTLLDVTYNAYLKKAVKKKLWDLSDSIEEKRTTEERKNEKNRTKTI